MAARQIYHTKREIEDMMNYGSDEEETTTFIRSAEQRCSSMTIYQDWFVSCTINYSATAMTNRLQLLPAKCVIFFWITAIICEQGGPTGR